MKQLLIKHRNCSEGFTLFELLISLVITGLIITIIFGAMKIGVKVWEKTEKDINSHKRINIISYLMKNQISSISTELISLKDSDSTTGKLNNIPQAFFLKGSSEYVEFISRYSVFFPVDPLIDFHTGLLYVRYFFESNSDGTYNIFLYEKEFAFFDSRSQIEDLIIDGQMQGHVLLANIENFNIEYLKLNSENETEWQESWNMDSVDPDSEFLSVDAADTKFPLAIKISFKAQDNEIEIYARIISRPVDYKYDDYK
jgi:competence protein ComGC